MNSEKDGEMAARVGELAPDFTATAVVNKAFEEITLSSYRGKNVILFFWPLDFTFVCPTEVVAFSDAADKFAERNTALLGVSTDSQYTHLAWQNRPRSAGGLGDIKFPMIADLNHEISRNYGVLIEGQGIALRGLFLIDRDGIIRHSLANDLPLGRNVDEALRMVDALAHFEKHGEVCPANWHVGEASMVPDPVRSQSFFQQWGNA
jgi:alkyl hydroperoxide reductase subunit AhpC